MPAPPCLGGGGEPGGWWPACARSRILRGGSGQGSRNVVLSRVLSCCAGGRPHVCRQTNQPGGGDIQRVATQLQTEAEVMHVTHVGGCHTAVMSLSSLSLRALATSLMVTRPWHGKGRRLRVCLSCGVCWAMPPLVGGGCSSCGDQGSSVLSVGWCRRRVLARSPHSTRTRRVCCPWFHQGMCLGHCDGVRPHALLLLLAEGLPP